MPRTLPCYRPRRHMPVTGRELGPMLRAERRARRTGKLASESSDQTQTKIDDSLEPEDGVPRLWWNAIVPIFVTIFIGARVWFSCTRAVQMRFRV